MDVFNGRYYRSCKLCLRIIGLWPYQNKHQRIGGNITFFLINMSLAVPQFILLVQKWGKDFNITVENLASILFAIACLAKYIVAYTSVTELKLLFSQIANDWQNIKDEEERKILHKYSKEALTLVMFYTIYLLFAWFAYTAMPFAPIFLNVFFPLQNGSHDLLMPFYANYVLFDQNDYHYWACSHISVVYFTSFFLYSGVDGTYVLTVKHTCGLFAITRYRIETMMGPKNITKQTVTLYDDAAVQRRLRKAVSLHNETIKCFYLIEDSFSRCFIVVQMACVIVLAMCMGYVLLIYEETYRLIRVVAFLIGIVMHLLYLNWIGQQIMDSSEEVFETTYNSEWYLISTSSRKFTNIIMSRSINPCILTAGKITNLSMESFGVLIKTSMSYFTVFLSIA